MPRGIYALCDDGLRVDLSLPLKAQLLVEGGAMTVQLRLKRTRGRAALVAARAVVGICRTAGALCIINDRVDLALLADADGVHVGELDLPADEARRLLGPERILGVTVRGLDSARAAKRAGASYVGLGPIFPTETKSVGVPPLGLAELERVVGGLDLPVVAIAGITRANVASVAATGVRAAAVLSDALNADDIVARTQALVREFESGMRERTLR